MCGFANDKPTSVSLLQKFQLKMMNTKDWERLSVGDIIKLTEEHAIASPYNMSIFEGDKLIVTIKRKYDIVLFSSYGLEHTISDWACRLCFEKVE
jgi:hypothetical protein